MNWPNIPDHLYRILIIVGSGSAKANALLNLTKHHLPEIEQIYFYVKNHFESKYQLFINGRKKKELTLRKERAFPLRIFSVSVTKLSPIVTECFLGKLSILLLFM